MHIAMHLCSNAPKYLRTIYPHAITPVCPYTNTPVYLCSDAARKEMHLFTMHPCTNESNTLMHRCTHVLMRQQTHTPIPLCTHAHVHLQTTYPCTSAPMQLRSKSNPCACVHVNQMHMHTDAPVHECASSPMTNTPVQPCIGAPALMH